jgi:hypothetical protein
MRKIEKECSQKEKEGILRLTNETSRKTIRTKTVAECTDW